MQTEHNNELKENNRRSREKIKELEEKLGKVLDTNKEEIDKMKEHHQADIKGCIYQTICCAD